MLVGIRLGYDRKDGEVVWWGTPGLMFRTAIVGQPGASLHGRAFLSQNGRIEERLSSENRN